jgi:ligand-binding sensor domain-containing protein
VNKTVLAPFKMTRSFLVLIVAIHLHLQGFAQFPDIQKIRIVVPAGEPVFSKALEDKNGYIWLGSEKGLYRFNGIGFRQYYPVSDSADFHITALHEDDNGIIWIGCRDGSIYHLKNGSLLRFNPEEGTAGQAISDIVTGDDGTPWWSTNGEGIYYFRDGRVFNINHEDGLNDDYVYDLECDHNGVIWAGTDGGLASCRLENGHKIVEPLDGTVRLPDIIVRIIKEDPAGRLWLGFQDGGSGYFIPGKSGFFSSFPVEAWSFGPVQDIEASADVTWISTAAGELLEVDNSMPAGNSRSINAVNIRFGKIYDLLDDRESNIWILAHSGLYRSSGNRLTFLKKTKEMSLENIHAIRNDNDDPARIWFSNDQGLCMLNLADGSIKKFLESFYQSDLKIMSIYQDRNGYIWAGTFNCGVFRIRPSDGSWIQVTEAQGLVNNNVLSISGHDDTLWMATLGGASEVILNRNSASGPFTITSQNLETGMVNNFIYSVYEDTLDQIWFATDGDGISVKTKKGWVVYNEENGLGDDVIYSITGDDFGNIWIATASKGIYKFSDGKFTHFGLEEGLSSHDITAITTVKDEVVVVNDDGLDIIHIPSGKIAHYGEELGLSGISPDLNVICKDLRGDVWIGSRFGMIRYKYGKETKTYGPQTLLEEMSVYLEPREMEEDLVLKYNQNHVSFKYTGLWYSNPAGVSYQVMLEGYDLGWKDTYDRQVIYSNLPPGKYVFRARSSLDRSFRSASEAVYHFRIARPFWLSIWFIVFMIILIAGGIYMIIRLREERLRRIERAKKEKVEFEFQVLKNQVNPHFLFNSFSTLMALIEEQPQQALQYTEKLSDFFRIILQFKDQQVISLSEELSLMESYFFLLKKRFGENLKMDISLESKLNNTLIPPMTLQILVENAVKHNIVSKDKPLWIKIFEEDGKLIIENNLQLKMIGEVSTGIGLENVMKRYRLITDKEPGIEKSSDIFRIKLPIIR